MAEGERTRQENPLSRWEPAREVGPAYYGARDPFERLFRMMGLLEDGAKSESQRFGSLPAAIDVDEDDESYDISVELPGVQRDDVELEAHRNVLTVRAEKRRQAESDPDAGKKRRSRWSERSYGSVVRSFSLPDDADADALEASFDDGVLTIHVPKSEAAKPRTIDVKSRQ